MEIDVNPPIDNTYLSLHYAGGLDPLHLRQFAKCAPKEAFKM